ncbi:MAG: hypoxanthine phosphoribosyltransferase [Deltaproteobacteria bacterium]|nr:hypoxanthine phosphoribosyltransferase [Deltaproteobacteria bacterium]
MIDEKTFTKYLNSTDIEGIVASLANQLNRDYEGKQVVLIGVLKGCCVFIADLCRQLKADVEIDFVRLTSQGKGLTTPGTVSIVKDVSVDIRGKHVLIVEEIIDSGRTLKFLYDRLQASQPASVEVITFLDKKDKRMIDVPVKYSGRQIDDQFLVGYGLDLEEKCRNLPEIYFLKYPN